MMRYEFSSYYKYYILSCGCAHRQICRSDGQRAVLFKPKGGKKWGYCSCLSLLPLPFTSNISPSLSVSLSFYALGNIVIIKAKEYLWVWILSISLCPLWPAIITHTHTHTVVINSQVYSMHTNTCTNTHNSISTCDWITFWLIVLLRAKQW